MTTDEIKTEVSKLKDSQRTSLRNAIGTGTIQFLKVSQRGPYTEVTAKMYEMNHVLMIGPRGKVMTRSVF